MNEEGIEGSYLVMRHKAKKSVLLPHSRCMFIIWSNLDNKWLIDDYNSPLEM